MTGVSSHKRKNPMLDFSYEPVGENSDLMALAIKGDLTADNCDYLLKCVESQVEDGYQKLILNCDGLSYISSMGLGMLVRVHSRMKKIGGDVKLANLHGTVAEIFRMMKLDRLFRIYPSVEAAAASYAEQ